MQEPQVTINAWSLGFRYPRGKNKGDRPEVKRTTTPNHSLCQRGMGAPRGVASEGGRLEALIGPGWRTPAGLQPETGTLARSHHAATLPIKMVAPRHCRTCIGPRPHEEGAPVRSRPSSQHPGTRAGRWVPEASRTISALGEGRGRSEFPKLPEPAPPPVFRLHREVQKALEGGSTAGRRPRAFSTDAP